MVGLFIKVVFLHSPILGMPGGLTTIHAKTSRDVGFTVKYMVERRRVPLSSAILWSHSPQSNTSCNEG